MTFEDKLKNIRAITYDVDGVVTDGNLLAMPDGDLLRVFDAKDSFAIRMVSMAGLAVGVITGATSGSIKLRMLTCGVPEEDIYLHSRRKITDFEDFCRRHSLKAEEVLFLGDDIPDVPVLKAAGIGVAPCDACEEAKAASDFISPFGGGKGCFRHTVEMVLKSQGKWRLDTELYSKRF